MAKLKNKDIAEALGLSTAAVSMVLNDKPGVSDDTRRKVLKYYHDHADPSPLTVARSSKKALIFEIFKKSGEIVIDKPFFSEMMASIEIEAKKQGYVLIVTHYDPSMDIDEHIEQINSQGAAGVIILATEMTNEYYPHYEKLDVPYVLLDGYLDDYPCNSVTLDNSNAIYRAYQYAYDMGHRNIGYLKCSTDIPNFTHRLDGFFKARRELEPDLLSTNPIIYTVPGNLEGSNAAMKTILEDSDNLMPTCFIADLDFIAIGAMMAMRDHGMQVPDDISIIGFDDIEFSAISSPPLTSFHLHQKTLGKYAVKMLLEEIQSPTTLLKNIRVSSELIIRKSVKNLEDR